MNNLHLPGDDCDASDAATDQPGFCPRCGTSSEREHGEECRYPDCGGTVLDKATHEALERPLELTLRQVQSLLHGGREDRGLNLTLAWMPTKRAWSCTLIGNAADDAADASCTVLENRSEDEPGVALGEVLREAFVAGIVGKL